jgi:hypothetical protein
LPDLSTTPCFSCGKVSEPAFPGFNSPPLDALTFTSPGGYGSALFDPMRGDEYLLVIICDDCIAKEAGSNRVLHCTTPRPVPQDRVCRIWKPEAEAE